MAVRPLPARVAGAFVRCRVAAAFLVGRFAGARVPAVRRSVAAAWRRVAASAGDALFPVRCDLGVATAGFADCRLGVAWATAVVLPVVFRPATGVGAFAVAALLLLRPPVLRSGLADAARAGFPLATLGDRDDFDVGCLLAISRLLAAVVVSSAVGSAGDRVACVARGDFPFDAGKPARGSEEAGTSGDRFAGRFALPTRSLLPLFLSATFRSAARLWFG